MLAMCKNKFTAQKQSQGIIFENINALKSLAVLCS